MHQRPRCKESRRASQSSGWYRTSSMTPAFSIDKSVRARWQSCTLRALPCEACHKMKSKNCCFSLSVSWISEPRPVRYSDGHATGKYPVARKDRTVCASFMRFTFSGFILSSSETALALRHPSALRTINVARAQYIRQRFSSSRTMSAWTLRCPNSCSTSSKE